jgi:hypothetical protein
MRSNYQAFSSQVTSLGDSENAMKTPTFSSQVTSLGDLGNVIKTPTFSSQVVSLGDSENVIRQKFSACPVREWARETYSIKTSAGPPVCFGG